MTQIYSRPKLAADMAKQLLRPTALDLGLRSGLFLSGIRRIGKTTFLRNDLIPALEELGAVVVYVDLWSEPQTNPSKLVHSAVAKTLKELSTPGSHALTALKKVKGAELEGFGFKFGFQIDAVGKDDSLTLAQVFTELVTQAKTDVVLIIDEVQHALATDDGGNLLLALKAARDAINPRSDLQGHFVFIGTGSHKAMIGEMAARKNQAFAGAHSSEYPVLNGDYIDFLLEALKRDGHTTLPSKAVTVEAFKTLGSRPEEIIRALGVAIRSTVNGQHPDNVLPAIALALRTAAADVELSKVESLGPLAEAFFDRVAGTSQAAKRLFSAEAAADYSQALGREVRIEEIQPVSVDLLNANLLMRRGHGLYEVSDPFVKEVWLERKKYQNMTTTKPADQQKE